MIYVDTIGDLEQMNRRASHHFFDADTMRFFASRVHEPVIAHRFFITSEKRGFDDTSRESRIRMICDAGNVESVGDVKFATPKAARDALAKAQKRLDGNDRGTLAQKGVCVKFDPYDADVKQLAGKTERELMKAFAWRAYIGELPIGVRTTRTDARKMAGEAVTPCETGG